MIENYFTLVQFVTKKDKVHYFGRTESSDGAHHVVLFLDGMEVHGSSYFHKKETEVLSQEQMTIQGDGTNQNASFMVFPANNTNFKVKQTFLEV
jgi:hypothetical protein